MRKQPALEGHQGDLSALIKSVDWLAGYVTIIIAAYSYALGTEEDLCPLETKRSYCLR